MTGQLDEAFSQDRELCLAVHSPCFTTFTLILRQAQHRLSVLSHRGRGGLEARVMGEELRGDVTLRGIAALVSESWRHGRIEGVRSVA